MNFRTAAALAAVFSGSAALNPSPSLATLTELLEELRS